MISKVKGETEISWCLRICPRMALKLISRLSKNERMYLLRYRTFLLLTAGGLIRVVCGFSAPKTAILVFFYDIQKFFNCYYV